MLIDKDADLAAVSSKAVTGAFSYAGQSCIHTQRIYVEADLFDAFIAEFCRKAAQLQIGDPEQPDTDFSSMIDENNAKRIESWVDEAIAAGAKCLLGGKRAGAY